MCSNLMQTSSQPLASGQDRWKSDDGVCCRWGVQGSTSKLLGHLLGKVVHHELVKPAVIVLLLLCKWVLQAISATQHSPEAMLDSYLVWLKLVLIRGRDNTALSSPSFLVLLETLL